MKFTPNQEEALIRSIDLDNLGVIAPHKAKYYNKYSTEWLADELRSGKSHTYTTFWKVDEGCENRIFSQWYRNKPFKVNGRTYVTAEQYMMSEKALLFGDCDSYKKIMLESDPAVCKQIGRGVQGFNQKVWDSALREIIFHGNLAKVQSDIEILDALLSTGSSVLIEASPYDDIYGAGLSKEDLLNENGTLKVMPEKWHKAGSSVRAKNHLGFVLMAVRDLFNQLIEG